MKIAIAPNWLVLDVGSGNNPHPRADVLVDMNIADNTDRSGAPILVEKGRQFCIADAEQLPFVEKAFDFVLASHLLEHSKNPRQLCMELSRVGKGGYVECPSKLCETFLPEPFHKWYVSRKGVGLAFEEKNVTKPLSDLFYGFYYYGERRFGHREISLPVFIDPLVRMLSRSMRYMAALLLSRLIYVRYKWKREIAVQK